MEVIIFIGLVAVGLAVFYSWSKKDVPVDVVKTDQGDSVKEAPYKVEAPVPAVEVAPQPVVAEVAETKPAKPARKTAAKKTAAKKTAVAKKPAGKKKSA